MKYIYIESVLIFRNFLLQFFFFLNYNFNHIFLFFNNKNYLIK